MRKLSRTTFALAAVAALLALALGAPAASAEYLFDPALSLRGSCDVITPSADEVPDPPLGECEAGAHPPKPFTSSQGVTTDAHGNVYVASFGNKEDGSEGRVDVFDSDGLFISELAVPNGPQVLAVDSKGNLYVKENPSIVNPPRRVTRFTPTVYEPAAGNITYNPTPTVVVNKTEPFFLPVDHGMAVNPANDHLLIHYANRVAEFGSAAESNVLLDATMGEGLLQEGKWLAIDAARDLAYASDSNAPTFSKSRVRVFELEAPHELLATIDGSNTPAGGFGVGGGQILLGVDEESGHLLVGSVGQKRVLEFDEAYEYVSTIEEPKFATAEPSQLSVDNGASSPNRGYYFVNSGGDNVFAFKLLIPPEPPVIEEVGFDQVSETEAELQATINPERAKTTYTFEYTTQEAWEAVGFEGATLAGEGLIGVGEEGIEVAAGISGLEPGTAYRFRVFAENEVDSDEDEGAFSTFPEVGPLGPCENEALRTGASALLPDCRAYELVTPPDTNGRLPSAAGGNGGPFPSYGSAPGGGIASFLIDGGALPGTEGTGAFNGENYISTRDEEDGWVTTISGPNGTESQSASPGGISADQGYSFWATGKGAGEEGTKRIEGLGTTYIRYPDGNSELIGRGSLGTDPQAIGRLITENATHIVFQTINTADQEALQLEPEAPPDGTNALYDRTRDPESGDEETHLVSLLPGEETPAPGQGAVYQGASENGEGIAFLLGATLYLRVGNEVTFEIGTGVKFASVAANGTRLFYTQGGDLHAFDATTEEVIDFSETGDATAVNVASEGTRAYFASPSVLTGAEENPVGEVAQPLEQNLYLSDEGALTFVATVTDRDVEGEETTSSGTLDGLGLWAQRVEVGSPAYDPSRTTPEGSVLLFQSEANLTGAESDEHSQVYRYDSAADRLHCLSCSPTGAKPQSDATLLSLFETDLDALLIESSLLRNLAPDGGRAFFESSEPLVASDSDGLRDVYEWEEEGVGTCQVEGGCLYLISSGQSARDDYLFAISEDGEDVFFATSDRLLGRDTEPILSIYDARVGGGFPEPVPPICVGEGCRPSLAAPPTFPNLESKGPGSEPSPQKKCPKGKHKVKRHGKVVCVKKKKKHKKHHHKAGSGK